MVIFNDGINYPKIWSKHTGKPNVIKRFGIFTPEYADELAKM